MGINFGCPNRICCQPVWSDIPTYLLNFWRLMAVTSSEVRHETTSNVRFEHSGIKSVNSIISSWVKRHRRRLTWRWTLLVTPTSVSELKVSSTVQLLRLETSGDEYCVVSIVGWGFAAEVNILCWENDGCCSLDYTSDDKRASSELFSKRWVWRRIWPMCVTPLTDWRSIRIQNLGYLS